MRAISLWQPWATLWVLGAKIHETRSWAPGFRPGEAIAVHAGKKWDKDLAYIASSEPFAAALKGVKLYRGGIVGLVRVEAPVEMTDALILAQTPEELEFGQWEVGRFAIPARSRVLLPEPIPLRGMQGVWEIPYAIEKQIRQQLQAA